MIVYLYFKDKKILKTEKIYVFFFLMLWIQYGFIKAVNFKIFFFN
jgi:hypothetical protein